jgi:hypothetical protein
MTKITLQDFQEHFEKMYYFNFIEIFIKPTANNKLWYMAGTIKDDSSLVLKVIVYDYTLDKVYIHSMNVDWLPENTIEWFVDVYTNQLTKTIDNVKENVKSDIKKRYEKFKTSMENFK